MTLAKVTTGRDNNFNFIRMIAALGVLVSHSFPLTGIAEEPFQATLGMSLGSIALDIFFITSGFLVSGSLLTRKSTIEYLCARALRIYPALLVMVGVTVLGLGVCFTQIPLLSYFAAWDTYKYIVKNSTLIVGTAYHLPGVFEHNPFKGSVNGSLWSMPYEVRLYLILALIWTLFRGMPKRRPGLFKAAVISGAVLCGVLHVAGHFYFGFGDSFRHLFFMFFTGGAFYVLKEHVPLSWPVFTIFGLMLLFSIGHPSAFFMIYNLVLAYVLLFLAYIPAGPIRSYNKIGDYSYGLYIYAFPVQQTVVALLPGILWWKLILVSAPVAVALAVLSWHFVEKKALGLKFSLLSHSRRIIGLQPVNFP